MKDLNKYPSDEVKQAIQVLFDKDTQRIVVEQIEEIRKHNKIFEYELVTDQLQTIRDSQKEWFELLSEWYFNGELVVYAKLPQEVCDYLIALETRYEWLQMRKSQLEKTAVIRKYNKYKERLNGKH